jgi:hypothetical protein
LQKQLQTALILSVTFIWSHPWVGLNGLWLCISLIRTFGLVLFWCSLKNSLVRATPPMHKHLWPHLHSSALQWCIQYRLDGKYTSSAFAVQYAINAMHEAWRNCNTIYSFLWQHSKTTTV